MLFIKVDNGDIFHINNSATTPGKLWNNTLE